MNSQKSDKKTMHSSKSQLAVNLFKELGLDNLPQKEQEEIIIKIGEILQKKIILRVLDELDEEGKDEFEKVIGEQGDDEEAVLNFLRLKLPKLDEMVNEEIEAFKNESLGMIKKLEE